MLVKRSLKDSEVKRGQGTALLFPTESVAIHHSPEAKTMSGVFLSRPVEQCSKQGYPGSSLYSLYRGYTYPIITDYSQRTIRKWKIEGNAT